MKNSEAVVRILVRIHGAFCAWTVVLISCLLLNAALAAVGPASENVHHFKKRVALVIGNGAYRSVALPFALNDAKDMAAALSELGFDVTIATDADSTTMNIAIDAFVEEARQADVALFYFAGHGEQLVTNAISENFLLPTDVEPGSGAANVRKGVPVLAKLLGPLGTAAESRLAIVILDACRTQSSNRNAVTGESLPNLYLGGLAKMAISSGTFIAYGAAPGTAAIESPDARHGRFTDSLLRHIRTPNLLIDQVFRRVRSDVERDSNGRQSPREESALRDDQDFYFVDPVIQRDRRVGRVTRLAAAIPAAGPATAEAARVLERKATVPLDDVVAQVRATPPERRIRALKTLMNSRAPKFTPAQTEAVLMSYWRTARGIALLTMLDGIPDAMNLENASRLFAIGLQGDNRSNAAKTLFESLNSRHKLDPAVTLEQLRAAARRNDPEPDRCGQVAKISGLGDNRVSRPSRSSNAKLVQNLAGVSGTSRRMQLLHDVLGNQEIMLSPDELVEILKLFPEESRGEVLQSMLPVVPDLLAWRDLIRILNVLPRDGSPLEDSGSMARYSLVVMLPVDGVVNDDLTRAEKAEVEELLRWSVPVPGFAAQIKLVLDPLTACSER